MINFLRDWSNIKLLEETHNLSQKINENTDEHPVSHYKAMCAQKYIYI